MFGYIFLMKLFKISYLKEYPWFRIGELGTISNQAAVMPAAKPGIHKVYVEANEDPVAMQKGHAKEMKLINVYETKVPVCQGRRKLLGRRTFSRWETPSP